MYPAVADEYHALVEAAIYTSFETLIQFAYSIGTPFAVVTLDRGQVFSRMSTTTPDSLRAILCDFEACFIAPYMSSMDSEGLP